jgi:hypothetical protein
MFAIVSSAVHKFKKVGAFLGFYHRPYIYGLSCALYVHNFGFGMEDMSPIMRAVEETEYDGSPNLYSELL